MLPCPCFPSWRAADWATGPHITCAHCSRRFSAADLQHGCRRELLAEEARDLFLDVGGGAASGGFLRACVEARGALQFSKDVLAHLLRRRLSLTDANALVGRGKMFVLSTEQAMRLFGGRRPGGLLLDVGAGAGDVTAELAPMFDEVLAMEASAPMLRRLRRRGFCAVKGEDLGEMLGSKAGAVDCVALMNVLDRCDRPSCLLADVRRLLRPSTGRLLLALVLPFRPLVERGARRCTPIERLPLPADASWEDSVSLALERVFKPAGFELEALARAPYLSQGDLHSPVYALDDAIFLLRSTSGDNL
mmetsp:Transcript_4730/g.13793  ORF Transcript_4730/g.13793 Transcript_4730/m.13793 type:complete len:305 (-) Transcript_4730:38-952(-)